MIKKCIIAALSVLLISCGGNSSSNTYDNGYQVSTPQTCEYCGGQGMVACGTCNGYGMVSTYYGPMTCPSCSGLKGVLCSSCGGSGSVSSGNGSNVSFGSNTAFKFKCKFRNECGCPGYSGLVEGSLHHTCPCGHSFGAHN